MAKNLDLKTKWTDEKTLSVSWTDVVANDTNNAASIMIQLGVAAVFITGMVMIFLGSFGFGFLMTLGSLAGAFIGLFWVHRGTRSAPNAVEFSAESVKIKGHSYPTDEVTQFEYGTTSALTGNQPQRDGQGNSLSDPFLVRMWLNNAAAIEISSNNWQSQINHEIRDSLAKALDAVRKKSASDAREKIHGTAGEYGVPDY